MYVNLLDINDDDTSRFFRLKPGDLGPLARTPEDGIRIKEWLRSISEFSLVFTFEV